MNDLQALIVNLVNHNDFRRVVTVSDICTIEGLSKPQVLGKERYLLPNFGVSQYPAFLQRKPEQQRCDRDIARCVHPAEGGALDHLPDGCDVGV